MEEKLKDYKERHVRWQDTTIIQLGTVNNLLIGLASGFLAFTINNFNSFHYIPNSIKISTFFLVLSIFFGIITSLSRLYDFRITRNIVLSKQRFLKSELEKIKEAKSKDYKPKYKNLPFFNKINNYNFQFRWKAISKILLFEFELMTKDESVNFYSSCNSNIISEKFKDLCRLSDILGIVTWRSLKLQLFTFFCSVIAFTFHFF